MASEKSSIATLRSLAKRAKLRWLRWLLPSHRWSGMQFVQAVEDREYVRAQSAVIKDGHVLVFVFIPPALSGPFEHWCADVGAVIEKRSDSPGARVVFKLGDR